ncbi:hypothetical protein [Phaffia rhodozyma]|uniref:Uncharacterized protein n=1 Tax=Phaffia rhodozyma TaxID=264483 RepID=A0A0F7ST43_PHARH|nr:hypothetical protein [Phaffia rhodozyma]
MPNADKELSSPKKSPLALPAPSDVPAYQLDVNGGGSVKLDDLGPMIVNTNGTLSRITNWKELSEPERERTIRLLVKKRNVLRLQNQPQPPADSTTSSNDLLAIVAEPPADDKNNKDVSNNS